MTERPQHSSPKKPFAHKALKTSLWSNDSALSIKSVRENGYRFSGRVLSPGAVLTLKVTGQNFKIPMEVTDQVEAVVNRLRANLPRGIAATIVPVEGTAPPQFEIAFTRS